MRKDKKDVSKIEEIQENRQSTVTNIVLHEKEDHVKKTYEESAPYQKRKDKLKYLQSSK